MTPEFPEHLRRELLDDFYAECDELLTAIRESLPGLQQKKPGAAHTAASALCRHTHSLKGISAIVGLREAETLAHAIEELMRHYAKGENPVPAPVFDILVRATQVLENIAIAHRLGKPLPDTKELLDSLAEAGLKTATPPPLVGAPMIQEEHTDPVQAALAQGKEVVQATFAPSPERDSRGVNVASVRERLGELGEILSAAPEILGKGKMVFHFRIGLHRELGDVQGLEADGVTFTPLETPSAPAREIKAEADQEPLPESASLTPSHIVRVDLARLDELMRIMGEMVIQRSRLDDRIQNITTLSPLRDINNALARSLREMRTAVTRVRMVPISELFTRIPFVVHDLMRNSSKQARVQLEGSQTEIDKYLVERLKEPLLHLVRNAFAHGVETPSERAAAGKPAEATITLGARSEGENVVIQVRDDGRGIDGPRVLERARKMGIDVQGDESAALLRVLCHPGFSTRDEADMAAGRGVGMAVVENTLRELGGLLSLETGEGRGTTFRLRLPLTLSIADAILVRLGNQTFAIPQSSVSEIVQAPASQVRTIQQTEIIPYRDGVLPVLRLKTLFHIEDPDGGTMTILVVNTERGSIGLIVDHVLTQREIVIRPLADPLVTVPGISGATELGDGRLILIINPNALNTGPVRPSSANLRSFSAPAS